MSMLFQQTETLKLLAEIINDTLAAGATKYYPSDSGVRIERYKLKTITMKADFALSYAVQVSDDRITWDDYATGALTANTLKPLSFEEDFYLVRVAITNTDTVPHTVNYVRIKGRVL